MKIRITQKAEELLNEIYQYYKREASLHQTIHPDILKQEMEAIRLKYNLKIATPD